MRDGVGTRRTGSDRAEEEGRGRVRETGEREREEDRGRRALLCLRPLHFRGALEWSTFHGPLTVVLLCCFLSLFVAPVPLLDRWYSGSVVACQILPGRIRQEGESGRQVEGGRERKATDREERARRKKATRLGQPFG